MTDKWIISQSMEMNATCPYCGFEHETVNSFEMICEFCQNVFEIVRSITEQD